MRIILIILNLGLFVSCQTEQDVKFDELKDLINLMLSKLEKNISNILSVLDEYSSYNYLNRVDKGNLKADLEKLVSGINHLGDSITSMLIQNKEAGLTLQVDAAKI